MLSPTLYGPRATLRFSTRPRSCRTSGKLCMHATSRSRRETAERRVQDANRARARRSRLIGLFLIAGTLAIAVGFALSGSVQRPQRTVAVPPPTVKADVTVNFGAGVRTLHPA